MFSEIKNTRFFMERSLDKRAPVRMENKALSHCVFDNCSIGTQNDAAKISRFKNIRLSDCEILNCMVGPAVFEDIEINNLKTGDIAVFNTPLLKRVRLAGKIGKLKISNTRPIFRFLLLGRARPFNHNQPRKPVCCPTKPHSGKRRVGFRFRRQASGCGRYVAVSHRFGRKRNRARRADGEGEKTARCRFGGIVGIERAGDCGVS